MVAMVVRPCLHPAPLADDMLKRGIPVTRENYLALGVERTLSTI
jgi:hypothetical protein